MKWMMDSDRITAANNELVEYGFLDIVEEGGLFKKPKVCALSERWREISVKLMEDPARGRMITRGRWSPYRKPGKTGRRRSGGKIAPLLSTGKKGGI